MKMLAEIQTKRKRKKRFKNDIELYSAMLGEEKTFEIDEKSTMMIYEDNDNATKADSHYFLQDYYMAKRIIESGTKSHFDIGSRIDGFVTHLLAAGVNCTLIDIRPFPVKVEGLDFIQADATNLESLKDNSLDSISSLHAIEHFGLGRYGDDIDPFAWKKVFNAISRKMKRGAFFYLGLPVGNKNKVIYNAHRIFEPATVVHALPYLELESFAYIHNYTIYTAEVSEIESLFHKLGDYDCGLFVFRKK